MRNVSNENGDLRKRVEQHLRMLECGLREGKDTSFEVFYLKDGKLIIPISDLDYFAYTNNLISDIDSKSLASHMPATRPPLAKAANPNQ